MQRIKGETLEKNREIKNFGDMKHVLSLRKFTLGENVTENPTAGESDYII